MQKEQWREVDGSKGHYYVSDAGRVKVVYKNGKESIMKQRPDRGGYLRVNLTLGGKKKTCRVHRLVAVAFVPGCAPSLQVNHKDEITAHNSAKNLEWTTAKAHASYGHHGQNIAVSKGFAVQQVNGSGEVVATFHSIKEAARLTGTDEGTISRNLRGLAAHAGGYQWRRV